MLKTLSAAFSTQPLYITCTNDHRHTDKTWRASVSAKRDPVADCAHDNVGPADFKACVDGLTCYWYKWDSSSVPMTWHNVRPPGKDTWSLPPLSVSVEDIIASSVRSDQSYAHFQGLSLGDISSPSNFQAAVGLNASLPGMFNIPVCLTPDHSWSTIVDGHHFPMNAYENSIPRNPIKNLPCYCGPWGRDTRRVWKQIPLELDSWENTVGHCGYQLYDRIEDKLERFVASCRLDMHAGMGGLTRFRGRAPECDVVTAIVDRLRLSPAHLKTQMPELYRALLCHTDMLSISERDKCQAYLNRSLKEWEDQAAPRPKKSKPTVDMPEIVKTGRVKSHPTLPPPSFFKTWVPPPKAVPTRRPT
ncbi:hypothetical protein EDC01DRAFT_673507 [Geopyxis carbonaria]|nr:hypothetical protein EDC01DRAFT_673507 [Geopyxis carbonaria]